MIEAVFFDLDGTLLNRDQSVKSFIYNQHERLNSSIGHISKESYTTRFIELDDRGYVWKDKVYKQLVHEFDITEITWGDLLHDYITQFKHHSVPFPNLHSMLEELKSNHLRLGLVTNGKGNFQLDNVKALGIENYFEAVLVSEWEGVKKPDPRIFKKALDQLKVSANQSIFVGDNPEKDVHAAQSVGMKGVWKRDPQWNNVEADFIIEDLAELPLIVTGSSRLK
ncbi:HAD family hydrolase [Halobacillus seohaensis]|uniref:HAD family hydrolase n=1 Tax=Halobacillus seohaensis TaxID=447421 RepID=A0ABW2EQB1_9BACI